MRANRTALLKADKKTEIKIVSRKIPEKQSEANCVFAKNDFPECDIAPDRLAFLAKKQNADRRGGILDFLFPLKGNAMI